MYIRVGQDTAHQLEAKGFDVLICKVAHPATLMARCIALYMKGIEVTVSDHSKVMSCK